MNDRGSSGPTPSEGTSSGRDPSSQWASDRTSSARALWVIAGGPRTTASSRHRLWNYRPFLEADGVRIAWTEYGGGGGGPGAWLERVRFLVRLLRRPPTGAVILIQKVLPPAWLVRRWRRGGHRVVYDFDDALFEHFSWGESPRVARRRRARFDRILGLADQVIAGSPPLAAYVRERGRPVAVLYPSLRRERFQPEEPGRGGGEGESPAGPPRSTAPPPTSSPVVGLAKGTEEALTLGWLGNRASQHYLRALAPALVPLFEAHPGLRLRVCSSHPPELPSPLRERSDFLPWSEEAELEAVRGFDIALSPMGDEPWSRARGGRVSVLLAMAAGAAICASPGGGLEELARPGGAVRFVDRPEDWPGTLGALLADEGERLRLGRAARQVVDARIWADVQYPVLRSLLFP